MLLATLNRIVSAVSAADPQENSCSSSVAVVVELCHPVILSSSFLAVTSSSSFHTLFSQHPMRFCMDGHGWPWGRAGQPCQLVMFSLQHTCAFSWFVSFDWSKVLCPQASQTASCIYCTSVRAQGWPVIFNALLQPISGPIRINSIVDEKEVCRLEISAGQLLFSCSPEHFSNLVNISTYPAVD